MLDTSDKKIYAYDRYDGSRNPDEDFDTLDAAGNDDGQGIWSDGTTMWAVNHEDDKVYAYKMSDKSRDSVRDLARIHRRRASGQCPEAARGCSCESGIMVLKQQSRPQNKEHPIDATTQPSRSHPNRV